MICETGFIKALWGVCSGREIFRSLRNQSWWRVVLHLFFLSLICGLITANIQFRRIKPNIEAAQVAFDGVFGENVYVDNSRVSWNWVAPVKAPEKFREMAIPSGGRLYYTGTAAGMVPESLKTVSGPIVIWSPEQILFAQSVNGKFNAICIDGVSGQMSNREMSAEQLEHIFKSGRKLPAGLSKLPQENAGELFSGVSALTNCFMCIGTVLRNFLLVWLYTGIFMAMYRLLNGPSGRLRYLTLKEMWKCGVYAAFPAMIIASLFPALELPFLSYETVFMMGLLIYWMAVAAKLERTPLSQQE